MNLVASPKTETPLPLGLTTKKEEEENAPKNQQYAPETVKLFQTLARMGQLHPTNLTQALFESIFGTPRVSMDLVRMWCRSLYRTNPEANLGQLLVFLATAPAVPCVRHHRVGGSQTHSVYFYPFGTHPPLAVGLRIPLVNTDVRVTRALQLLLNNKTAFPQSKRDPVFGFRTYYCFAYTDEAQHALDACRPAFLASAVCAVVTQLRLEVVAIHPHPSQRPTGGGGGADNNKNSSSIVSRVSYEKRVLHRPLTYYQAYCESKCIQQIRLLIRQLESTMSSYQSLGYRLLIDAMDFVLKEESADSMQFNPDGFSVDVTHMPVHAYPVLPDAKKVLLFSQQTAKEWRRALSMAKITAPATTAAGNREL